MGEKTVREIEVKAQVQDSPTLLKKLSQKQIEMSEPVLQRDRVFGIPGEDGGGSNNSPWLRILGVFIEAEKLVADEANYEIIAAELWTLLESLGVVRNHQVHDGYDVLARKGDGLPVVL